MKKDRKAAPADTIDEAGEPPIADAIETTVAAPATDPQETAAETAPTPAPTPTPEPAPARAEPLTKPDGGGSFIRDPRTGHLTRQEA